MTTKKDKNSETKIWLGIMVMFVLAVVLGLRSQGTISAVTTVLGAAATPAVAADADRSLLEGLAVRDSLIRHVPEGASNPFAQPKVEAPKPREEKQPEKAPAPRRRTRPKLLTLLYDSSDPTAQISYKSDRSGWLHVGDEFRNWKIEEITEDTVTVSRRNRRYVLR